MKEDQKRVASNQVVQNQVAQSQIVPKKVPKFSKEQIKEIREGIKKGIDTTIYANVNYTPEKMKELRIMSEFGLVTNSIQKMNSNQIREVRMAMNSEIIMPKDVEKFKDYSSHQMREIFMGIESNVEIEKYADIKYNAPQMKMIRLGLQDGLDITQYASENFTVEQMDQIRKQQLSNKLIEHVKEQISKIIESIKDFLLNGIYRNPYSIKNIDVEMDIQEIDATKNEVPVERVDKILDNEAVIKNITKKIEDIVMEKVKEAVREVIENMDLQEAPINVKEETCVQKATKELQHFKEKINIMQKEVESHISTEHQSEFGGAIQEYLNRQSNMEIEQEIIEMGI